MHFDFTIAFWPTLTKLLALVGLFTFLYKVYKKISSTVDAINLIVKQHHEMFDWYQQVKPNGSALRGTRHTHGE